MFYSGILTEPSRKEVEIREAASLRQQRRMKQAVQFIHKDSADLLPLDGLKKLGTSKDTVRLSIVFAGKRLKKRVGQCLCFVIFVLFFCQEKLTFCGN